MKVKEDAAKATKMQKMKRSTDSLIDDENYARLTMDAIEILADQECLEERDNI